MATITPTMTPTTEGIPRIIWEGAATGDTINAYAMTQQYGLAASIQIVGTFGGATVALEVSNDGTNWAAASDVQGDAVSATAAAYHELSVSAAYVRPTVTGGTGDDIDIIMVLRG